MKTITYWEERLAIAKAKLERLFPYSSRFAYPILRLRGLSRHRRRLRHYQWAKLLRKLQGRQRLCVALQARIKYAEERIAELEKISSWSVLRAGGLRL